MRFVYGPIPSRRLGRSLGVDPIPLKTCNWNCIYCQLGRSVPLLHERAEYAPRQEILDEILAAVAHHAPGEVDYITFAGSGEPTLHSGLGWIIRHIKEQTAIPVAVITNGSLLYLPEVRADLLAADVVMPTLCAGTADSTGGSIVRTRKPPSNVWWRVCWRFVRSTRVSSGSRSCSSAG